MTIKKITMDTNEGKFVFRNSKSCCCDLCAFAEEICDEAPCSIGYWVKFDDKPVTNGDRIRQMSDEEIVQTISPSRCPKGHRQCDGDCRSCFLDWLKSEYKEEK